MPSSRNKPKRQFHPLDHDKNGRKGGSLPKSEREPPAAKAVPEDAAHAEAAPEEPVATAPDEQSAPEQPLEPEQQPAPGASEADATEAAQAAEDAEAAPADGERPAFVEAVRLGQADALLTRMPLAEVQSLIGESLRDRAVYLQSTAATLELQERMRATEGRCAPIYMSQDAAGVLTIFNGVEALAAAMALGLESVFVIIIATGDAGAVQSWLNSRLQSKHADPEDDLIWRVIASDRD